MVRNNRFQVAQVFTMCLIVLSTLIKTPSGNILLDSGEGTTGQLTRRFGRGGAGDVTDVLRDLKCIFVSHVHGDHHIGLAKLLRQRKLVSFSVTINSLSVSDSIRRSFSFQNPRNTHFMWSLYGPFISISKNATS